MPDRPHSRARAWPIGAIIFSSVAGASMVMYSIDVYTKARGATDWMMIVPATAVGVLALAFCIVEDIRAAGRVAPRLAADGDGNAEEEALGSSQQTQKSLAFMALLLAYVAAAPYAGFDVATFSFLGLALVVQGERRPVVCIGFAFVATLCLVWLFVGLFDVRLPVAVL